MIAPGNVSEIVRPITVCQKRHVFCFPLDAEIWKRIFCFEIYLEQIAFRTSELLDCHPITLRPSSLLLLTEI